MNRLILQKRFQFVVGEGDDVLRGWCTDVRVENSSFLVLNEVILDVTRSRRQREYQEHSEIRFFNAPFAAFVNEQSDGSAEVEE